MRDLLQHLEPDRTGPEPAATRPAPSARRVRTRERLMAAAVGVFAQRGIIGASVEEICEAAGFTRGAFYSNFPDKDALVLAMIQQGITAQYAAAERAIADIGSTPEGLSPTELISRTLARFDETGRADRESALTQQELLLYAARVPAVAAPYRELADASRAQLSALIAEGMRLAGLEFTLAFEDALELLIATHEHLHLAGLFTDEVDSRLLQSLILSVTRPRARPRPSDHATTMEE